MKIRLAGIKEDSIVDGPGLRCTIFTQGCPHKCPGCHNPHTHDCDGGYEEDISNIISTISQNKLTHGVTISGGEPFIQPVPLLHLVKELKVYGTNIIVYTGYTWEELVRNEKMFRSLVYIDYLVDGPFIESKKSLNIKWKGSTNQRIIDVRATMQYNKIITVEL